MQLRGQTFASIFYGFDLDTCRQTTHTHTAQVYYDAGHLKVNQNGVFMAELRGIGFRSENANSMTDVTQHTLTDTRAHIHAQHFIYFQGGEARF